MSLEGPDPTDTRATDDPLEVLMRPDELSEKYPDYPAHEFCTTYDPQECQPSDELTGVRDPITLECVPKYDTNV